VPTGTLITGKFPAVSACNSNITVNICTLQLDEVIALITT